jgi:hypothetical protein
MVFPGQITTCCRGGVEYLALGAEFAGQLLSGPILLAPTPFQRMMPVFSISLILSFDSQ